MLKFLTILVLLGSTVYGTFSPPTHIGDMVRDLYDASKNTGDMMMMAKEWAIDGLISNKVRLGWCGLNPVLGGSGVIASQGSFSRTYKDLVNHNLIYFDIGVKMIGNWKDNQDTLTMKVDGSTLKSFTIFRVGDADKSSSCSGSGKDLETRLVGHFYHSASSVTISLAWDLSSSSEVSFAIADVSLMAKSSNQNPSTNPAKALLALTDTLGKGILPSGSEDNGKTNCPPGHYSSGMYCLKCNGGCQDCFGPSSSECYQCKWGYKLVGGQCKKCGDGCGLCTSECLLCTPGFMRENGGCNDHETCKTVISNKDFGDDGVDLFKICAPSCGSGKFMLWNSTCVDSCEAPLVQRRLHGESWCDYPCAPNEYLTPDGRCLAACPNGFSSRMENFFGFCDLNPNGCEDPSLYMYPNGSCYQNCSYPYTEKFGEGLFCSPPCPQGYFEPLNEFCMKGCEPEEILLENNILYCNSDNATTPCPNIYDNRYSNGSCISSVCAYPFQQRFDGGYFCDDPCPKDFYFHSWEKRCVSECKSGNTRVEGVIRYCDPEENCNSKTDYRYSDGSCLPYCHYPFNVRENEEGYQFCEAPCPDGQYFHTFSSQCVEECPRPWTYGMDDCFYNPKNPGCVQLCSVLPETTGCASTTDFKYPNGSCLSSCEDPFERSPDGQYCYRTCEGFFFEPENGYCQDLCPSKNVRIEGSLIYCDREGDGKCPPDAPWRYANDTCTGDFPPGIFQNPYDEVTGNYDRFYGPCPNRYYVPTETCADSCLPESLRVDGVINWCDPFYDNNSTIITCPSVYEYQYSNGSCLPTCPSPYFESFLGGNSFCNPPCALGFYSSLDQSCVDTCEVEFMKFEDGILYCAGSSNSGNTATGCPLVWDFKYPNGSCLPECPAPRKSEWHVNSFLCYPPCPLGYFDTWERGCINDCDPEFVRFEDEIIYCDGHPEPEQPGNGTNSTNSTDGCPSIFEYKYPNGSCLSDCLYPHKDEWNNGTYFCYPPCPNRYFDTLNEVCTSYCDAQNVRIEGDITYCDPKPECDNFVYYNGSCLVECPYPYKELYDGGSHLCNLPCPNSYFDYSVGGCIDVCWSGNTRHENDILICDPSDLDNGTNSTAGCPNIDDFKYSNRSCLSTCPFPYKEHLIDGSRYCNVPCPSGYFDALLDVCEASCEPEYIRYENGIAICDPYSHICTNSFYPDGSVTTTCTNPSGICPSGSFLFDDYSCNETCPTWYIFSENVTCSFPCGSDGALYPDGSCSSGCSAGYTLEMRGNFPHCVVSPAPPANNNQTNSTYTVVVGINIRYNISLAEFNSSEMLTKFINLLAELLGIDPSEITIISITEGSTIIDSKVELKSDLNSVAATKAKAQTMNRKLEGAAGSKALELEGVAVLNSRFAVTTPDNDQVDVKKSSSSASSSKTVVIIVVVAAAAISIALAILAIYRNKVKKQSLQVFNLDRAKEAKAEGSPEVEDNKRRDEEVGILDDNSRIHDGTAQSDKDQKLQRKQRKAFEVIEKEKPVSLNEIMGGVKESTLN